MSQTSNAADWLLGAFKKNPEGFLLLAAGAVLMMRQGGGGGSQALASAASSRVADTAAEARNAVADVTDRTMRGASEMASTATDYAKQATRKAGEQSERVMHQAQSAIQHTFSRVLNEQPLAIAVAGIAAGAAIASVFPTSDFEKETLGPIGDQVTEAAVRVGEQLKEAGANAGQTLMNAADQRGLNAGGLKEVASEVADAFTSSMGGGSGSGSGSGQQNRKPGGAAD